MLEDGESFDSLDEVVEARRLKAVEDLKRRSKPPGPQTFEQKPPICLDELVAALDMKGTENVEKKK